MKLEKCLDNLVSAHWKYIYNILMMHGEDHEVIDKIRFHYKEAFKHGWKHAMQTRIK